MIAASLRCGIVAVVLAVALSCWAQGQETGEEATAPAAGDILQVAPQDLSTPRLDEGYDQPLQALGGEEPWAWSVEKGELPPGLTLDPEGQISGTPSKAGEYVFTLLVKDSSDPPRQGRREFHLKVPAPLEIVWSAEPHRDGDTIAGSVKVTNGGKDDDDLTFIVVAVNEYGKAFALGYQRLQLASDHSQELPFSGSVPQGDYTVHADAVAEIAARNLVRRAWLESAAPQESK